MGRRLILVQGAGVAGVHAPAFVERRDPRQHTAESPRVAGVHAPAFVERCRRQVLAPMPGLVSPGFMPRPSLSGLQGKRRRLDAFVERTLSAGRSRSRRSRVSPGFTPRPSLRRPVRSRSPVSWTGVAEVHAPAFVERGWPSTCSTPSGSVAGVHAPAFVERSGTTRASSAG